MKIYIMLPFEEVKYNPRYFESHGTITISYKRQFKNKTFRFRKVLTEVQKAVHYSGGLGPVYTIILPKTFELYEEEEDE